jgi:hypothetical protein
MLNAFPTPEHAIENLNAELLPPPPATDLPPGFERLDRGGERKIAFVEPRR